MQLTFKTSLNYQLPASEARALRSLFTQDDFSNEWMFRQCRRLISVDQYM